MYQERGSDKGKPQLQFELAMTVVYAKAEYAEALSLDRLAKTKSYIYQRLFVGMDDEIAICPRYIDSVTDNGDQISIASVVSRVSGDHTGRLGLA